MVIKKLKIQIFLFPVIVSLVSVLSGCRTSEIEVSDVDVKFISNINLNPVLSWKVSSIGFTCSMSSEHLVSFLPFLPGFDPFRNHCP